MHTFGFVWVEKRWVWVWEEITSFFIKLHKKDLSCEHDWLILTIWVIRFSSHALDDLFLWSETVGRSFWCYRVPRCKNPLWAEPSIPLFWMNNLPLPTWSRFSFSGCHWSFKWLQLALTESISRYKFIRFEVGPLIFSVPFEFLVKICNEFF